MAAVSVIGPQDTKFSTHKSCCQFNISKEDVAKSNRTPNNNNRKIAPRDPRNIPGSAWRIQDINCDLSEQNDHQKDNISYGNDSAEEEKSALFGSHSDSNLLGSTDALSQISKRDHKETCKYIKLPDRDIDDGDFSQLISPVSTTLPSLDDTSVSIEIIKSVKRKKRKKKKSYTKFICPPYFILAASVIEISVYIWGGPVAQGWLMYSPHQREQVWRFISYMLLHSGVIHLTLNIIIQTLLATLLELEQTWWRCALVYLCGGICGALGASVFQPTLYMVGSSAGVYALLISHVANVIVRYSSIKYKRFRLFAVAVLAGSDIAFSVAHWYSDSESLPRIGWAAHCTGAASGLSLGLMFFKGQDETNPYVRIATWTTSLTMFVAIIASIIFNIFYVVIP